MSPSCIMRLPPAPRPALCVTATVFFAADFLFYSMYDLYYVQDHSFESQRQLQREDGLGNEKKK